MKRFILPATVALAPLSGCVTDQRLAELEAAHRTYVCEHQAAVKLAAGIAIANAYAIKDEALRTVAISIARADLALADTCDAR